ncbi:MAG: globin [Planctomycetota bacterium]|nr:globin [Planctomycetota bacterium]
MDVQDHTIYSIIGQDGFYRLLEAFYGRVRSDLVIGPMYPDQDWAGSEKRLRDFLIYRFGGPAIYIEERGHPRLRMRHMPFPIGTAARDRWLKLMGEAMLETELPEAVREHLSGFFDQTADFMRNQPEQ